jgi:hypothetical protein
MILLQSRGRSEWGQRFLSFAKSTIIVFGITGLISVITVPLSLFLVSKTHDEDRNMQQVYNGPSTPDLPYSHHSTDSNP